jgi:sortase A
MADLNGPVIVRHSSPKTFVKPGLHSHNITRRRVPPARFSFLRRFQILLLTLGLCALGYYGYTLADQYVYQSYENWAFDQQIASHSGVTFADYLRQRTPFGFLVGAAPTKPAVSTNPTAPAQPEQQQPIRPVEGSLLGRVEISRLNVSAMVREGVDSKTLSTAVGHIPSTALPGHIGNFAIAAHRDTLFRALKDIKKDDLVTFQSSDGTYTYQVVATKVVRPSDVTVLSSDGGGIIPADDPPSQPTDKSHLLTMITCYPFYYVGSAPKRFVVEAELVTNRPAPPKLEAESPPPPPPMTTEPKTKHGEPRHTRGSSRLRHTQNAQSAHPAQKKRSLWRRIFHVS